MTAEQLHARLQSAFPGADVHVVDTTGTQDHFDVRISAPQFEGLNRVRQHQAVYAALGDAMRAEIHALALKTSAP